MDSKVQLNLLTSCIFFEDKDFYKKLNLPLSKCNYNTQLQMTQRPLLGKLMNNLKEMGSKLDISKFELNCQIPGLNIIGITGYKKNIYKAVHIEILDEYTTLKNTENKPTGLMQLKLRLLEQQDEALIVVSMYLNTVIMLFWFIHKKNVYVTGLNSLRSNNLEEKIF